MFFLLLKMWMQIGKKWMHFNNVNLTLQPILFLMKNINMQVPNICAVAPFILFASGIIG